MFRSKVLLTLILIGRRFITLEMFKGDNHKSKQYHPGGVDYGPPIGIEALVMPINGNNADNAVFAYRDNIMHTAGAGERRIYSTSASGSTVVATVHLKNDGTINIKNNNGFVEIASDGKISINGNADFAVRFTALETAFNQLKADYDNLVSLYNPHTHNFAVPPPTTPANPSTADISLAKVNTVLFP